MIMKRVNSIEILQKYKRTSQLILQKTFGLIKSRGLGIFMGKALTNHYSDILFDKTH